MKEMPADQLRLYLNGPKIIEEVLEELFKTYFGQSPPVNGRPPQAASGLDGCGYENISAFLIKLPNKPTTAATVDKAHASDTSDKD